MNSIEGREDVSLLVNAFYAKIRKDKLLGPIFNNHISEEGWPLHLKRLTDFWETNLFGVANPKLNPSAKHVAVDTNLGHTIDQNHFGKWLELWFTTIDELFEGDLAFRAKESARKMATGQFMNIWNSRTSNTKMP